MRKNIVAGNWKMNKTLQEGIALAKELFANPDVDGGLIGGAALKVSDFKGIIDAFNA